MSSQDSLPNEEDDAVTSADNMSVENGQKGPAEDDLNSMDSPASSKSVENGQKRPAEDDLNSIDSPASSKRLKLDDETSDSKSFPPSEESSRDSSKLASQASEDILDLTAKPEAAVEENNCDDSDKENSGDAPMDLTTKAGENDPDVITLSDSDSEDSSMKYTIDFVELSPEEEAVRNKLVRKLQSELRNEETKLVLLKKIRQSQLSSQQNSDVPKNSQQRLGVSSAPPPLVRGNQQQPMTNGHKYGPTAAHHHARSQPQARSQAGPPPLVMAPHQQSHSSHQSSSQVPSYRPQPVVQSAPQQPVQTPEQRQAAAKLALRKQLEKTLLQIPPPKPPPPEMNFIPSVGSNEFIMLVGLEEIVKRIIDSEQGKPEVKYVFNPFTCCQCNTDFTPVWKRNKPGSKDVICEVCVTSNTKRALKQEHTNRLKSAFVKALQQEQEIEQRLSTQTSSPSPAASSPVNLSSYKPSAEQMRQHQNLLQAHQAQLRSLQGFPGANFPYNMSPSNLQRQILLDMIPAWSGKK